VSSNMTPMEVGTLFVQFSAVPDSERPEFLRQHPELRSAWVVDWALTAARLRGQMGEPEAKTRIASAALYIAAELGDHERQASARELLAEPLDQDRGHQATTQTTGDQPLPSRRVPKRTKELIASAAELTEKPSLRTTVRLMLRHPNLIPQTLKTAVRFALSAVRDPMQARAEIERAMAEAMDDASLARARELTQRAELEGDHDTAQRLKQLPAGIEALHDRLSSAVSKAFTFEVFDLLSAVASAGSEAAARQVVRNRMRLALQSEFLPALMQIRDIYSRPPDPAPNLDAFCALILNEVGRALVEMEPQALGIGGACTALMLADSPQALEATISRYRPLIDSVLLDEFERMSESFEARGLLDFATQPRLLANLIREYVNAPEEGLGFPTLDPQTLALLQVSFADTEEEAWAAVEEEPGLLSNDAIQQLRVQATFQAMQGDPESAGRLRRAADWLARWRSELADPVRNIVSQLAARVETGELTLDTALAELAKPSALAGLSVPHLGAVDERVIELSVRDLHRAEILAVLNDAAAQQIGGAKIRAYAAISLTEVKISQGAAREVLQILQGATEQAREAADPRLELRILGIQGTAYQQLGQFQEAAVFWKDAQDLTQQIGSEADQMPILSNLAHIYSVLSDMEQAFACAQEGYEIARRLVDRHSEASFLGIMAALSERTGRFTEAAEQLERAVEIFRDLGDRDREARTLGNLGNAYLDLGELQPARAAINESLTLAQTMGMRSVEMRAWGGLGDIALMEGRLQQAIEHFRKSLEIASDIGDPQAEAMTLNNLGVIHTRLNLWDQAERYLERAVDMARQIGDRRLEGQSWLNRGNNYGARGLWISAMDDYHAALTIARGVGDRHLETQALGSLGRAYEHQGYFQTALREYELVLPLQRELGDRQGEALTLHNVANSYAGLGQFEQALVHYNQALSIASDLANPDHVARIQAGRGHTYVRMRRYAEARDDYRASIEHIERTRSSLSGEEHRMGYFGWDKMGVYRSLVQLLVDRDRCWNPREALETVERSRSRAFLDQLGYTELIAPQGVDPILLARERALAVALQEQALATRQVKSEDPRRKLAGHMASLQTEWNTVLARMQEQAPEYVALRRGEPASLEEIRALLQPPGA
jgi:tetratricopeptide (TPR) repeat protein